MKVSQLVNELVAAAIKVHHTAGPGLLESAHVEIKPVESLLPIHINSISAVSFDEIADENRRKK